MGKKGFVDRNRQEAARMLRVDGLLYLGSEKLGAEDTVFLSEMNFRYFITLDCDTLSHLTHLTDGDCF